MPDPSLIQKLQEQIQSLHQQRPINEDLSELGIGKIEEVFAGGVFPKAAIHEFLSPTIESAASTNAFLSVLLSKLTKQSGPCLWITPVRNIYPPALKLFGLCPEKILFLETWKVKDRLWAIEESLKCRALSAVIGEVSELSFSDSRRLQLAVEKSRVTGFIHRIYPKADNAMACVTRWKISPLPSYSNDGLPGPGFPRWQVELLKLRNGKPFKWSLEYSDHNFNYLQESIQDQSSLQKIA